MISAPRIERPRNANVLPVVAAVLVAVCGCSTVTPEDEQSAKNLPAEGVHLRVAVVDDPDLAKAIDHLRGEWNAQSGAELTIRQVSAAELAKSERLDDVVIAASAQLGELAAQGRIAPLPEKLASSENPAWSEIFGQLRSREAAWGRRPFAVPLGSPVLVCYYRPDLLEKLGRKPPADWTEFQDLSRELADRARPANAVPDQPAPWFGAVSPLAPGWAGQVLLARAAAYASHREMDSTLWNIETMAPLIAGAPFVRALEELAANAALGPQEQLTYDPAAVRRAFWEGKCGLAITWPSAADKTLPETKIPVGFAELPGSDDVYNLADKVWEKRREDEDPRVPLLAVSGRLGMVGKQAARPDVACQFLFWLSSDRWSRQVLAASPATTLFRRSQLQFPQAWVEKQVSAAGVSQYASITQQALSREKGMLPPRIKGRSEYMAALDEAVQQAVRGEKTAQAALDEAAAKWRKINDQNGLDSQRGAYWESLGLD